MSHTFVCIGMFTLLFAACQQSPQPPKKPDFTGTWKFNPQKSKLEIPAPDSTVFVVEHREPCFHLTRTHTFAGQSDTWGIELTTDGREFVREETNRTLRGNLVWEGDALVFTVHIRQRDGEELTDRVRYVLAADRKSFTAYESYRGRTAHADNVWVLDKQD